jgi:hypothetical protein
MSRIVRDTTASPPRHRTPRSLTSIEPLRRCASSTSSTRIGTRHHVVDQLERWIGVEQCAEQLGDLAPAERIEIEHRCRAVALQGAHDLSGDPRLLGPERADEQHVSRRGGREIPNCLDAVGVGGMQVVEDEYRAAGGRGDFVHEPYDAFERQEAYLRVGQSPGRIGVGPPFRDHELQPRIEGSHLVVGRVRPKPRAQRLCDHAERDWGRHGRPPAEDRKPEPARLGGNRRKEARLADSAFTGEEHAAEFSGSSCVHGPAQMVDLDLAADDDRRPPHPAAAVTAHEPSLPVL